MLKRHSSGNVSCVKGCTRSPLPQPGKGSSSFHRSPCTNQSLKAPTVIEWYIEPASLEESPGLSPAIRHPYNSSPIPFPYPSWTPNLSDHSPHPAQTPSAHSDLRCQPSFEDSIAEGAMMETHLVLPSMHHLEPNGSGSRSSQVRILAHRCGPNRHLSTAIRRTSSSCNPLRVA